MVYQQRNSKHMGTSSAVTFQCERNTQPYTYIMERNLLYYAERNTRFQHESSTHIHVIYTTDYQHSWPILSP
jgi:hypothetical protein